MRKNIVFILGIFVIGLIGGIFGNQIVWPLLVERPLFYGYRLSQAPTYVTEVREITVQENTALQDAVDKVKKTVVAVESRDALGRVLRMGSGLVLTADGLVITLNELLPQGAEFVFLADGKPSHYKVVKRDPLQNLALVQLEDRGLGTVPFADIGKIRLGQRVFLVAAFVEPAEEDEARRSFIINEGAVREISKDLLGTTMTDTIAVKGAPAFTIEGNFMGLAIVDGLGRVSFIPSSAIRLFAGL